MTPQQQKDKIISDLYLSGKVHKLAKSACWRNRIADHTLFHEDLVQVCFENLIKFDTDELIAMHEDDPVRILKLCTRIISLKGLSKHPKAPEYPQHSLKTLIFNKSNLNTLDHLSPTDSFEQEMDDKSVSSYNQSLIDPSTLKDADFDADEELWKKIRKGLSPEENKLLDWYLNLTRGPGRLTKVVSKELRLLFYKIKRLGKDEPVKGKRIRKFKPMDKKKALNIIETELNPVLAQYHKTKSAEFGTTQSLRLREVMNFIVPGITLQLTCTSCVLHYLNTVAAWHEEQTAKPVADNKKKAESEVKNDIPKNNRSRSKKSKDGSTDPEVS